MNSLIKSCKRIFRVIHKISLNIYISIFQSKQYTNCIYREYFLLKNSLEETNFSFSVNFCKLISFCTSEESLFVDLRRTRSTGESRKSYGEGEGDTVVSCSRKSRLSGCNAISPGEKVLCTVIRASSSYVREARINFNPRSNFVWTRSFRTMHRFLVDRLPTTPPRSCYCIRLLLLPK